MLAAERFIEDVGFAACMTDCRKPGPSLYVAVCGRRDAVMPRNVQKDPEASLTWTLKDEIFGRGRVYYAKLARGRSMFVAPRMIPYFHAIWGVRRSEEPRRLSRNAQKLLRVFRREWEIGTSDLRGDSGMKNRAAFGRALDELQAAMLVVPSQVVYQPKFTYIWTLAVGRFPDALRRRMNREVAVREIARCFLTGAGMTVPGELARVTGCRGLRPVEATARSSRKASRRCSLPARIGFFIRILVRTLTPGAIHDNTPFYPADSRDARDRTRRRPRAATRDGPSGTAARQRTIRVRHSRTAEHQGERRREGALASVGYRMAAGWIHARHGTAGTSSHRPQRPGRSNARERRSEGPD